MVQNPGLQTVTAANAAIVSEGTNLVLSARRKDSAVRVSYSIPNSRGYPSNHGTRVLVTSAVPTPGAQAFLAGKGTN